MSNLSHHTLTIEGARTDLEHLLDTLRRDADEMNPGEVLTFHSFVPASDSEQFARLWGTPGDASESAVNTADIEQGRILIRFATAFGEPTQALFAMRDQNPHLAINLDAPSSATEKPARLTTDEACDHLKSDAPANTPGVWIILPEGTPDPEINYSADGRAMLHVPHEHVRQLGHTLNEATAEGDRKRAQEQEEDRPRFAERQVTLRDQDIIEFAYAIMDLVAPLAETHSKLAFDEANCYAARFHHVQELLKLVDPAYLKRHARIAAFYREGRFLNNDNDRLRIEDTATRADRPADGVPF